MRRTPALLLLVALLGPLGLIATACGSSSDSGGTSTTAPESTSTTKPSYEGLEATDITFHPVLKILTCDGGGVPGATETTATETPSSTVPAVDGKLCYELGPEGGNGTDVRDAKVYADGVGIEVAVREDSVAPMNLMFNACDLAIAACPASSSDGKGYVAIVVDGQVVSTPAIQAPDLASTPFVITGNFDKAQATNIAAAINGS